MLNCDIYQGERVPRVADTELVILIAHIIRPTGLIPDGSLNQTKRDMR